MADPLSIISSIITLLQAAKTAYDTVQGAIRLPEAFGQIHSRIDLATETLVEIKRRYKGQTNEENKIKGTLRECERDAENIKKIFVAVCSAASSDWLDRQRGYVSNIVHDHKSKVEDLWRRLLEGLQVLQGYHLFKNLSTGADMAAAVLENNPLEQALRALSENNRMIIEKERNANGLQFDTNLRIVTISVPRFQTSTFEYAGAWHGSIFRSSTFQLADILEMLPGQKNHDRSDFQVKELEAHEYVTELLKRTTWHPMISQAFADLHKDRFD
ncbi:unnamed protein product [Zymoseptoria tritici ST99CH_1E4]|uniref:NACHT-NTPase and P-loop NTPases N-terminal domain-containing protein n=1 Tax=Zymoseptoria tritici ST99CH_1E4 TaxID=1276532 RepID=A0A2H1G6J9_ZYMTR|nr:unnamed protein product [Zymoseptoria tritici ST99CH_1E4]